MKKLFSILLLLSLSVAQASFAATPDAVKETPASAVADMADMSDVTADLDLDGDDVDVDEEDLDVEVAAERPEGALVTGSCPR